MTTEADAFLGETHQTIRIVPPGEGPYRGRLVAGDDEPWVAVRTEDLGAWDGWAREDAAHLAVPVELIRTAEGHEVLLPWCTERLADFLTRREAAAAALAPGECTTLLASLLRGAVEAADAEPQGEWWLTASARPMFVIGAGAPLTAEAIAIVRRIAVASAGDRAIERLCTRVAEILGERRRIPHEAAETEEALCAWAAPKPLRRMPVDGEGEDREGEVRAGTDRSRVSPAEAARIVRVRDGDEAAREGRRLSSTRRRTEKRSRETGRRLLDAPLMRLRAVCGTIREPLHKARARWDGPRGNGARGTAEGMTRRWPKPLLLGAGVATLLAVGGLLWPSGDPSGKAAIVQEGSTVLPSDTGTPRSAAGATSTAGGAGEPRPGKTLSKRAEEAGAGLPSEAPSVAVESGAEPLAALPVLLRGVVQCEADRGEACARAWADGEPPKQEAVGLSPTDASHLIEDFGDLAAIRVESRPTARMVIVVRTDDGWRIRDVYDVAEPPSEEGAPDGGQIPS
ncbi:MULTISPECIES: hypothetical protein [Bacteria]|uniref:hypothetical protein n=1 Tax=Bacteria TaxID=2 RepID=UPI003C7BD25D